MTKRNFFLVLLSFLRKYLHHFYSSLSPVPLTSLQNIGLFLFHYYCYTYI